LLRCIVRTEEQDFQEIENSTPELLQEGNLSNLCEGEGETGEIEEPRSPIRINQPLNSPDKGSAAKIIVEGIHSPQTLGPLLSQIKEVLLKQSLLRLPLST
jgi:hypothetical protein